MKTQKTSRPVSLRKPINPVELHWRLKRALGLEAVSAPKAIVTAEFPEICQGASDAVTQFRDKYLLREVLRKYPGFDLGIDTRKACFESFHADEQINRATNDRLRAFRPPSAAVGLAVRKASRKAVGILGRFETSNLLGDLRFGPGATTSLSRFQAATEWKLSSDIHVTKACFDLAVAVMPHMPAWEDLAETYGSAILSQEFDMLMSVPKNALTDRTIGVGPDFNVMLQLAVGTAMRRRLYQAGINLNDQAINQSRAHVGSVLHHVATLDLKSASNSVTQGLVWQILGNHPEGSCDRTWFNLLDMIRVERYMVGGETREYELFSAMGNGATFEVESLIFHCLASSCCEILGILPDVTVYGDDLTVPSSAVPFITEVFEWCGLRLNLGKSFWDTGEELQFRESCGKHFLGGFDVSPFYVDGLLDKVDQVLLLANNLVRWARYPGGCRDKRLLPVWLWVVSHLPPYVSRKCRIPYGDLDDGLISDFDEACPSVKRLPVCNTPIGFKVNTLKRVRIPTMSYVPKIAFVASLYQKSKRRFTPPREVKWLDAFPKESDHTVVVDDGALHFGARTVVNWPWIGPWIDAESVSAFSPVDLDLAHALSIWHRETSIS